MTDYEVQFSQTSDRFVFIVEVDEVDDEVITDPVIVLNRNAARRLAYQILDLVGAG